MHQYDKVLSYIDYFSTAGEEVSTRVHNPPNMPYVSYYPDLISFIDEAYLTDLLGSEYLSYLISHIHKESYLSWSRFI